MGIEIIHHQNDFFCFGIQNVDKLSNDFSEINLGAPFGDGHVSLAGKRFEEHEKIRRAVALILVIESFCLSPRRRNGLSDFLHQLFARFIQTNLGIFLIVTASVDRKNIFHGTHKIGIRFRWNYPLLLLPRLKFVFFRVR